jgi:hypothetical protein
MTVSHPDQIVRQTKSRITDDEDSDTLIVIDTDVQDVQTVVYFEQTDIGEEKEDWPHTTNTKTR